MSQKNDVQVDFDETQTLDLRRKEVEIKDEPVKDNWFDESESEQEEQENQDDKQTAKGTSTTVKPAKKKSAKEKAAEKEAEKKREQEIVRLQLEAAANRTPEEIAEEKRRLQKAQEDADFAFARDTFVEPTAESPLSAGVIDGFEAKTLESFDQFRQHLVQKIIKSQSSEFYSNFLNSLFQDLSLHMPAEDVRKFGATLTTLAGEKAKQEKAGKGKVKPKKKPGLIAAKKDDSMATYDDFDEMDDLF